MDGTAPCTEPSSGAGVRSQLKTLIQQKPRFLSHRICEVMRLADKPLEYFTAVADQISPPKAL